jgi:hypothetical protein
MKQHSIIIIGIIILYVPLMVTAADKAPSFAGIGTWILDISHSDLYPYQKIGPNESALIDKSNEQSGPLIIEQIGDSIRITNNLGGNKAVFNYPYGKNIEIIEIPAQAKTIKVHKEIDAKWTKDKITILETIPDHPQGKTIVKKSFALSKGNKILTMKVESTQGETQKESWTESMVRGIKIGQAQNAGINPYAPGGVGIVDRGQVVTTKLKQVFNKGENIEKGK